MGDRGNVVLNYGDGKKVYLYTHWSRYKIGSDLQAALKRGVSRWDDPPYLARIIFQELLGGDGGTTGFGIDVFLGDGDETAELDLLRQTVRFKKEEPVSYTEFIRVDRED
jgi:hypothetical protein